MKIPRVQRKGLEGTNPGFRAQDQHALDRINDHTPKVQIYTSKPVDENEIEQPPLCIECGSKLMHLSKTQKYLCTYSRCGKVFDSPDISETPLLTKTNQSMSPYQSQHYDPNSDEGEPYFVSWNPDKGGVTVNKNYEVTWTSSDRRVKHIKCKGYPTDISINAFDD